MFDILTRRLPSPCNNLLNLIDSRCPRKHGLSIEHLSNKTPQSPHINLLIIILRPQKQFWCPVPPSRNVISHNNQLLLRWFLHKSHKTKITQLRLTILIDKNVARFDIPMDEVGLMQIIYRFGNLIDNKLFMFFLQLRWFSILSNQTMQIDVHMFEYQIYIFVIFGSDHLLQPYYVLMFQLSEKHDLPVGSLSVGWIWKCIKVFLEGFYWFCLAVLHLPNMPVCTTAYFF